jgi:hypothetical protein
MPARRFIGKPDDAQQRTGVESWRQLRQRAGDRNLWAIVHGLLSWLYVIYYALRYQYGIFHFH